MTSHSLVLAVFGLGGGELMIILAIFLLLFGGAKLPALARGLGQSIKEFKKAAKEDDRLPRKRSRRKPRRSSRPATAELRPCRTCLLPDARSARVGQTSRSRPHDRGRGGMTTARFDRPAQQDRHFPR